MKNVMASLFVSGAAEFLILEWTAYDILWCDFCTTVETTSFATPTLDSPPPISIYYLPYKNGEVKKFVLY